VVRVAFTLAALGVWLIWWNLLHPPGQRPIPWLVQRFDAILDPDFIMRGPQVVACFFASIVSVFWLASFRFKGDTALHTARVWFTGAALLWCTVNTLLLPWINETKSFRTAVAQMESFVAHSPYTDKCIAHYQLGENMAPMLEYFMGRTTPLPIISLNSDACPLFITFALRETPDDIDPRWRLIWRGTRRLDVKTNELRLYAKKR